MQEIVRRLKQQWLEEGESLVLTTHRHWVVLARNVLAAVLVIAVVAAVVARLGTSLTDMGRTLIVLVGVALALVVAFAGWASWYADMLTLTTRRVVLETGIRVRDTKLIPLDRVRDIETRQSLLGLLLGYGTIEVEAIGDEGAELFRHAPNPSEFRERTFQQLDVGKAEAE